jgi:hypothetical protein
VRKKRVSKKTALAATAVLEEKLDGLVQMLQRSQPSIPEINQAQGHVQDESVDFRSPTLSSSRAGEADGNSQANMSYANFAGGNDPTPMRIETLEGLAQQNGLTTLSSVRVHSQQGLTSRLANINGPPTPATSTRSYSTGPEKRKSLLDFPPESEPQLEEYLETYRTKISAYLPIVCIRPETTMLELRKQRPFLLLVIRAICSKNLERQMAIVEEIKKILGREMLIEGAKNLDLFLGILVFAGWCHLYICNRPIISTIMHLAMSLASDLGLTKPLPNENGCIMLNYTAQGCPKPITVMASTRTMEERRAIVGLYLVSSM